MKLIVRCFSLRNSQTTVCCLVVLNPWDSRLSLSSDCSRSNAGNLELNAENIHKFVNDSDTRIPSMASVVSPGQAGINDSESEHLRTTMKDRAEMPVAVTPAVPTTKKDLSETFQSLLSPQEPINSTLTFVTPLPGCGQDRSERGALISGQSDKSSPKGRAIWPSGEASDYEDFVETHLGFGYSIKFREAFFGDPLVVAEDKSGSSNIVLDTVRFSQHVTIPKSNFNQTILLVLSLMAFCLKMPKNHPEPVQFTGQNLWVQRQLNFDDWLSDAEFVAQPIGYAIAGIELVSLASITFIVAIFVGL